MKIVIFEYSTLNTKCLFDLNRLNNFFVRLDVQTLHIRLKIKTTVEDLTVVYFYSLIKNQNCQGLDQHGGFGSES